MDVAWIVADEHDTIGWYEILDSETTETVARFATREEAEAFVWDRTHTR